MHPTKCIIFFLSALSPTVAWWPYGQTPVRGVNLGGWLVLEKWIVPSVFAGLPEHIYDEYKLCEYLGRSAAEERLRNHWETWVTEDDIRTLKEAGINHLRLPFGYWAIEKKEGEPWVQGSWDYVMRTVWWAKKYGIQVMIDLHGAPGSQNGNDHSGRAGNIGFFYDDANIQLATRIMGRVAQIFNVTAFRDTVTVIQILNEPVLWGNDYNYRLDRLKQYYRMAYDEIRKNNAGAVVAVHDAFIDYSNWFYLRDDPHYYWIMLDAHHYQVFSDTYKKMTCDQNRDFICGDLRTRLQRANQKLWTVVGEWSLATNNCQNQAAYARNQIGVYESLSGWAMWNFKHGNGWTDWDFLASYRLGRIPKLGANKVTPTC